MPWSAAGRLLWRLASALVAMALAVACGASSTTARTTPPATAAIEVPTSAPQPTVPGTGGPGGGTPLVSATTAAPPYGTFPPLSMVATATTTPGTATPTTHGTTTVTLADADNGRTVTAPRGATVVVALSSLLWTFGADAAPAVLQPVGTPSFVPAPAGSCVPGEGCGTATETFVAVAAGTATVTASRTSCGEARACTGSEGTWTATVVVSGS